MADIPHAVLSEHFQKRLLGRRLRSAVFLTFQFDPAFFEQEILPVFFDLPLSHAPVIRLLQLENALRDLSGDVAVYYDAHGLIHDQGSAKLDIRRFPVQHRTGVFHAKNVFLLVEAETEDESGHRPRSLLVASLSANLTRSGWWENVEVCHVEEIAESDKTRLKDDLLKFLRMLRDKVVADEKHTALNDLIGFLRDTEQRQHRSTAGRSHTHFFYGRESLADFLQQVAGEQLTGANLEIISPYFDDAADSGPLRMLVDRFQPKKTLVYLPRDAAGIALCREELYHAVRDLPGVSWGSLPKKLMQRGPAENAKERFVHAKVYRFFTSNPKWEVFFVGSVNLTTAAHQLGGNLETGFFIAGDPPRRPEFWLSAEDKVPGEFKVTIEEEGNATSEGSRLNLRYHWDRNAAEVFWDDRGTSPDLRLEMHSVELGTVPQLPPRQWTSLNDEFTKRLAQQLEVTSWVTVHGEKDEPVMTLVQEEAMSHKPSLLFQLSAADILRYWSLLTSDQRAAFLEARAPELALSTAEGAALVTRARAAAEMDTLFDRFAGYFHAFDCLERAVVTALDPKDGKDRNVKEATYRLFGHKYDSLGNLLKQIGSESYGGDDVDRYVIVLCAQQLCSEVARLYPDFWAEHREDVDRLQASLAIAGEIRRRLIEADPDQMEPFLGWFERRFLRRSRRAEEVGS